MKGNFVRIRHTNMYGFVAKEATIDPDGVVYWVAYKDRGRKMLGLFLESQLEKPNDISERTAGPRP